MSKLSVEFDSQSLEDGICFISHTIRNDFLIGQVKEQLNYLTQLAKAEIAIEDDAEEKLKQLLTLFYQRWGFDCSSGVYVLSDAMWLDYVLETRCGSPSMLAIVLLHIARELNIPLKPIIFPTQLLLRN